MTDKPIITVRMGDVRAAGMCGTGQAQLMAARHGISWKDFLRNGITSDKLEATGDALLLRLVEVARGRQQ